MDSGTLIWGAPLFLVAIGVGALATGRIGLDTLLGASDANVARWLVGAVAVGAALLVAVIEPAPMIRLPAIALGVAGVRMIVTASRLAPRHGTGEIIERAITDSASTGPTRWRSRERDPDR